MPGPIKWKNMTFDFNHGSKLNFIIALHKNEVERGKRLNANYIFCCRLTLVYF
jgi:hypothetical protein